MTGLAIALFVCGALCEAAGIGLVAVEIVRERRRSSSFAEGTLDWAPARQEFRRSRTGKVVSFLIVSTPREIENELYARGDDLRRVLLESTRGDLRIRGLGVAMLLVDLALSTSANIVSLAR